MKTTEMRLKFICRLGYGDALVPGESSVGDIPVFGSNGVYSSTTYANTGSPAIIVGRKGSYGKINWSDSSCFASDTTFFIDDKLSHHNLRWLFWVLQALGLDEGSNEAAVPGINRETIYEQKVYVPSSTDQRRIADYLDAEATQIDSLILEKEQILALLIEKQAVMICHAVTRGLDPKSPTKHSGIDWIGEVPVHWEVRRLKSICKNIDTGTTPAARYMENPEDGDFIWFTPGDFNATGDLLDSRRKVPTEAVEKGEAKLFPKNSILIVGIGATLGKVGFAKMECSANQQINVIVKCNGIRPEYLKLVLLGYEAVFKAHAYASTLAILNQERLGVISVPLPPAKEQEAIEAYCRKVSDRITPLKLELESSVALLKERRSALITAAVTGQIEPEVMTA